MSSNLQWEPAQRERQSFSTAVKFALRKRFGEPINHCLMDQGDLGFVEGLIAAGVEGARDVKDAIDKFGAIIIDEV